MDEMLMKLPKSKYSVLETEYDSDKTVTYYPLFEELPKKVHEIELNLGIKAPKKPKRRLIKEHPLRGGFLISVHGVKKHKSCTYLVCKICGCKAKFLTVRDWNLHHQRVHSGVKLQCNKCGRLFKTPSFLKDHQYEHSEKKFSCDKCKKCFVFKSTYRIHHQTHLWARMHKCFAGSCGWEYKWPQDLH